MTQSSRLRKLLSLTDDVNNKKGHEKREKKIIFPSFHFANKVDVKSNFNGNFEVNEK